MRALVLLALTAMPALAEEPAWDDIRRVVWGERIILDGSAFMALDAPYRTDNDARTMIAAEAAPPAPLTALTLVLDENPMPVSAVLRFAEPQPQAAFTGSFRINGPTPVHLVAETTDGRLFAVAGHVKTSGQGACAAPPGTDPEEALATLGQMELLLAPAGTSLLTSSPRDRLAALAGRGDELGIDIDHPSHSGMQMDQISLLFIPMRYVETIGVDLDGVPFAEVTGSISLSENPRLSLGVPRGTETADVTMTDTEGTTTTATVSQRGY